MSIVGFRLAVVMTFDHVNAVHGTGVDTQITACAFGIDNGMHDPGSTQDGVHGAGLNTLGATNTFQFANDCGARREVLSVLWVKWHY